MPATVIIGGGIIGLSTAYYLSTTSQKSFAPYRIHIIDSAPSLLLSASGFAGGFLARDWFSPAITPLGGLSFRLHRELADIHDGYAKWGYAASTAYSLAVNERGVSGTGKKVRGEDWLLEGTSRAGVARCTEVGNEEVIGHGEGPERNERLNDDGTLAWFTRQAGGTLEVISSEGGCAQVEPRELCEWLQAQCEAQGVEFHLSTQVTDVVTDEKGQISGIKIQKSDSSSETELEATNIVITAGAWTSRVFSTLFPNARSTISIGSLAGYSIVVRSPRYSKPIVDPSLHHHNSTNRTNDHTTKTETGMCHSVFCAPGRNWTYAPEAISRMTRDGKPEVYVAGLNDPSLQVPETAAHVKSLTDPKKAQDLKKTTVYLTGLSKEGDDLLEDDLEIVREGLCFRPVSESGKPVVARLSAKQLGMQSDSGDGDGEGGGVFVAAGHGPWGISLGPGTGMVVSEMVLGRETSVNLKGLGVR